MDAKVTVTLTLPHHDWIRLRAYALAARKTLEEVVTDALRADLHRKGAHPALPAAETFAERLTATTALLAQLDALTASLEAASDSDAAPPSDTEAQIALRSPILRQSHVKLPLQQPMTIRPRIARDVWITFKGHSYLHGEDPNQTVFKVIVAHLGPDLLDVGEPSQRQVLADTLGRIIEQLGALHGELSDPGFEF